LTEHTPSAAPPPARACARAGAARARPLRPGGSRGTPWSGRRRRCSPSRWAAARGSALTRGGYARSTGWTRRAGRAAVGGRRTLQRAPAGGGAAGATASSSPHASTRHLFGLGTRSGQRSAARGGLAACAGRAGVGRLQGSWRKGAHPVEVVARALAVEEALAVRVDVRLLLLELLGLDNKSEPARGAPSPHVCSFGLPGRAICETPAENASYSAALSATLARCCRSISNTCFVHQKSGSVRPRSRAGRHRARGAPTSYFRMRHAGVLGAIPQHFDRS
jgi:hypothetical protein